MSQAYLKLQKTYWFCERFDYELGESRRMNQLMSITKVYKSNEFPKVMDTDRFY